MTRFPSLPLLLLVSLLTVGCEDDCTKTITHPGYTLYTPGGSVYYPAQTQEIPCNDPEPDGGELGQNVTYLTNFSVEVLEFEFTPNTGNNTSRLQFKIKLNNLNIYGVKGIPVVTLLVDGKETTGSYPRASVPCNEIEANSSCILTYDKETSLDVAIIENIYLVEVKYVLSNR